MMTVMAMSNNVGDGNDANNIHDIADVIMMTLLAAAMDCLKNIYPSYAAADDDDTNNCNDNHN